MSGQKPVKVDAGGIAASAKAAVAKGPPPVHLWDPPFCGDLDMEIRADGTWFYEGTPIGRAPLVRLFASILKREGEKYFLVTPVEKVGLRVEDVPFVAIDVDVLGGGEDQDLRFETNVGDVVVAGPEHALRVMFDPQTQEPRPYVHVRAGLEARIDRKSFYRLVELGVSDGTHFGLWSGGAFFPVIPTAELYPE